MTNNNRRKVNELNLDEDQINEYERMIAIREKQQKLYEEQAQRAAQLKQQVCRLLTNVHSFSIFFNRN